MSEVAHKKIRLHRTERLGTGSRGVLYLPDGSSLHTIEDFPIPTGTYFMTPDSSGKHTNWVIEYEVGTFCAEPAVLDDDGQLVHAPRMAIEVHVGNTLRSTEGCICPGIATNTHGVAHSRDAIAIMRSVLKRDDPDPPIWVLEIV